MNEFVEKEQQTDNQLVFSNLLTMPSQPGYRNPNVKALMQAVIIQSLEDARSKNTILALDAVHWLMSTDCQVFMEAAELNYDPLQILINGRLRKLRRMPNRSTRKDER